MCNDWLLLDVVKNGREYTFAVHWDPAKYPELWEQVGARIKLAGVIQGENWMGLKVFSPRAICQ
jgi:hypothetical protein